MNARRIPLVFVALCLALLLNACSPFGGMHASATPSVILLEEASSDEAVASPAPVLTPSPSPSPSPAPSLYLGDTGETVDALQARLIALGYLPANAASGMLDARTLHCANLLLTRLGKSVVASIDGESTALLLSDGAPSCDLPLAGVIVGLDPGHQSKQNREQEPVAPGSKQTKKKVSSGTSGHWSGLAEYEVNLHVALLLRDLLLSRGAIVVMTREKNDVDVSNAARAMLFNEAKTDYALRLHCNGSGNDEKHGAFVLVPKENPFQSECVRAAELLLDAYCAETGLSSLGLSVRDDQTGFNWCERMIINIEMAHMTNKADDLLLAEEAFWARMAAGLCEGIERYFAPQTAP